MSRKEFFKPTLTKIIVSVIIVIVFVPFIHYDTGIRCIQAPCLAGATGSLLMYLLFSPNLYIYTGGILFTNLIIGLFVSYLLSCTLVTIRTYGFDSSPLRHVRRGGGEVRRE